MKLVYEKRDVIEDIAETYLGSELVGYFLTSDKETARERKQQKPNVGNTAKSKAAFVPRTLGIVLGTPQALVVAFRGTEPTNLINMRSSGKISMSHPDGMGGVHDGKLCILCMACASTLSHRVHFCISVEGSLFSMAALLRLHFRAELL